jgi:hypothetical protein
MLILLLINDDPHPYLPSNLGLPPLATNASCRQRPLSRLLAEGTWLPMAAVYKGQQPGRLSLAGLPLCRDIGYTKPAILYIRAKRRLTTY